MKRWLARLWRWITQRPKPSRPRYAFRPERVFVSPPSSIGAADWVINDIKIGNVLGCEPFLLNRSAHDPGDEDRIDHDWPRYSKTFKRRLL